MVLNCLPLCFPAAQFGDKASHLVAVLFFLRRLDVSFFLSLIPCAEQNTDISHVRFPFDHVHSIPLVFYFNLPLDSIMFNSILESLICFKVSHFCLALYLKRTSREAHERQTKNNTSNYSYWYLTILLSSDTCQVFERFF